MIYEVRALLMS